MMTIVENCNRQISLLKDAKKTTVVTTPLFPDPTTKSAPEDTKYIEGDNFHSYGFEIFPFTCYITRYTSIYTF